MTNELNALLGKGSEFQGKLTFEGTVRIDGRFTGEIFSDGVLIIGEGAEVQAEIRVAAVQVWGHVTGNVTASEAVELHAPAELRGNITSPALHIDKGVYFDGACQMTTGKPERPALAAVPQQAPSLLPRITSPRPIGPTTGSHQMASPVAIAAPSAMAAGARQTGSGMFLPEATRQTGELTHKF